MFSYSTGYYNSPPDDQYLKFKNRCSLMVRVFVNLQVTFEDKIGWAVINMMNFKIMQAVNIPMIKIFF